MKNLQPNTYWTGIGTNFERCWSSVVWVLQCDCTFKAASTNTIDQPWRNGSEGIWIWVCMRLWGHILNSNYRSWPHIIEHNRKRNIMASSTRSIWCREYEIITWKCQRRAIGSTHVFKYKAFLCNSFVILLKFLCLSFDIPLSCLWHSFVIRLSCLCHSFVIP